MKTLKDNETRKLTAEERKYGLCFVEEIEPTYRDYDLLTKKMRATDEFVEYLRKKEEFVDLLMKQKGCVSSNDLNAFDAIHEPLSARAATYDDYVSELFSEGYTHYLWFTDDVVAQDGDCWTHPLDDSYAPYEHDKIFKIAVKVDYSWIDTVMCNEEFFREHTGDVVKLNGMTYDELVDYVYDKTQYNNCTLYIPQKSFYRTTLCVKDINRGAASWMFFTENRKDSVVVNCGESVRKVLNKIKKMNTIFHNTDEERG